MSRSSPRQEGGDEPQLSSSYRIERLGPASRADLMITSRAKRSTAGNKLKALLDQELEKDEIFAEVENDVEFHADENEGIDIVDSDFDRDSDDQVMPGDQEDESEGERELEAREKAEKQKRRAQARNVGIIKRPLPHAPSARKQAVTTDSINRDAKRRRISFAPDQTTSTSSSPMPDGSASRRSSARSSTVQSKMQVESRLSEAESRRAAIPVKAAPKKRAALTQDALIAEALEVEEENRESLRRFLELEEERRARMRQRKDKIVGPFVRWVSVGLKTRVVEEISNTDTVKVEEHGDATSSNAPIQSIERPTDAAAADKAAGEPQMPSQSESRQEPADHVESLTTANAEDDKAVRPVTAKDPAPMQEDPVTGPAARADAIPPAEEAPANVSTSLTLDPVLEARQKAAVLRAKATAAPVAPNQPQSSSSRLVKKYELQARTVLSVERMPEDWDWLDEFNALLGSHCDWQSFPFVSARNRPLRPRQSICPITGLPAIYKCPRTGIPYATAHAYSIITKLLQNRYLWTGGHGDEDKAAAASASRKGKRKERTGSYTNSDTVGVGAAPPQMGVYMDSELEGGPGRLWDTARERCPSTAAPRQARTSLTTTKQPPVATGRKAAPKARAIAATPTTPVRQEPAPAPPARKPHFDIVLTNALAPGDEASVMAAALNLPAGSTRSGRRVQRPQ